MKLKISLLFFALTIFATEAQNKPFELKEINDIAYTDKTDADALQKLNLILPEKAGKTPVLIWIGGGSWAYVDRNMEMDLCRNFAKAGMAVASVGHRLSPATWKDPKRDKGIEHPQHILDLAAAFKWIYDHAQEYGYDASEIYVGGYSSGGHLTALLATYRQYLNKYGLFDKIKGIIPIAGTYDIVHYYNAFLNSPGQESLAETHVKAVFGKTEKELIAASPTTYISNLKAPMLLISEMNTYNYTKVFEDKLNEGKFKSFEVLHIKSLNHSQLWKNLSEAQDSEYRNRIIDFILKGQQ